MAIKKIIGKPDSAFAAVALYLNDIEDIQSAISDVLGEVTFSFRDGKKSGYIYDTLEEVIQQRGATTLNYLQITAYVKEDRKQVVVTIDGTGDYGCYDHLFYNHLYFQLIEENAEARLYQSLRSILDNRKLALGGVSSRSHAASRGGFSRVYLYRPHETPPETPKPPSFIRKHTESIIVAVVTAILILIATQVVTYGWNRFLGQDKATVTQPKETTPAHQPDSPTQPPAK